MQRLPLKQTEKLAYRHALGETLGKLRAEERFKRTKAGWQKSLREHIGKAIDRLDVLEVAVFIPTTYIIYNALKTATIVTAKISLIVKEKATKDIMWWLSPAYALYSTYMSYLNPPEEVKKTMEQVQKGVSENELILVCLSIMIAYLLVRHGGQIIGLLGGSIDKVSNFAMMLLG